MSYNFYAGPAKLFPAVKKKLADAIINYKDTGMGIEEISHRSPLYEDIHNKTISLIKEILHVPDNYSILLMQGGATAQFSAIPLNLSDLYKPAAYVLTGHFSELASEEASKYTKVTNIIFEGDRYKNIPDKITYPDYLSYCHVTYNNTDTGIEFHSSFSELQEAGIPVVADMSSCLFHDLINVSDFDLIYAGTQKNLGIAGCTIVIIKNDLIKDKLTTSCPRILNYKLIKESNSLLNTPCTLATYTLYLTLKYIKKLDYFNIIEDNKNKADKVKDFILNSNFYSFIPDVKNLSYSNIVFKTPTQTLDDKFVKVAESRQIYGLKGYRSVGGLRVSLYNAITQEDVDYLLTFMESFENANKENIIIR